MVSREERQKRHDQLMEHFDVTRKIVDSWPEWKREAYGLCLGRGKDNEVTKDTQRRTRGRLTVDNEYDRSENPVDGQSHSFGCATLGVIGGHSEKIIVWDEDGNSEFPAHLAACWNAVEDHCAGNPEMVVKLWGGAAMLAAGIIEGRDPEDLMTLAENVRLIADRCVTGYGGDS